MYGINRILEEHTLFTCGVKGGSLFLQNAVSLPWTSWCPVHWNVICKKILCILKLFHSITVEFLQSSTCTWTDRYQHIKYSGLSYNNYSCEILTDNFLLPQLYLGCTSNQRSISFWISPLVAGSGAFAVFWSFFDFYQGCWRTSRLWIRSIYSWRIWWGRKGRD